MRKRRSIFYSFRDAFSGITYGLSTQRNMRIHLTAAVSVFIMAWYMQLSSYEWIALVLVVAGVMVTEMLNTAIETVVDLISPEYHILAKIAKNVAAGAVLINAMAAIAIAYIIFGHRLLI